MDTKDNKSLEVTVDSEDSLNIFRNGTQVLILFILPIEGGGFKVCWGIGDRNKTPIGQSSGEVARVTSSSEAESVLRYLKILAGVIFETDDKTYVVRGAFDCS